MLNRFLHATGHIFCIESRKVVQELGWQPVVCLDVECTAPQWEAAQVEYCVQNVGVAECGAVHGAVEELAILHFGVEEICLLEIAFADVGSVADLRVVKVNVVAVAVLDMAIMDFSAPQVGPMEVAIRQIHVLPMRVLGLQNVESAFIEFSAHNPGVVGPRIAEVTFVDSHVLDFRL